MIKKGILAGVIFGLLDITPMLFMQFEDSAAAVTGSLAGLRSAS